jgi:hypothetical protein
LKLPKKLPEKLFLRVEGERFSLLRVMVARKENLKSLGELLVLLGRIALYKPLPNFRAKSLELTLGLRAMALDKFGLEVLTEEPLLLSAPLRGCALLPIWAYERAQVEAGLTVTLNAWLCAAALSEDAADTAPVLAETRQRPRQDRGS